MSASASDQNRSMSVSEVKISDEADSNPSEISISNLTCRPQSCELILEVPESPKPDSVEQSDSRAHPEKVKTVHHVFELPDSHPLLEEFEERVTDDPCPYLLAIWPTGAVSKSFQQHTSGMCNEIKVHPSCRTNEEETIKGTILIPWRTAMRGKFPVNESYFQTNEVFADHESSELPLDVPKAWLSNLPKRSLHCGMTATTIFRGATAKEIQNCCSRGYICLRGFHKRQRVVKRLNARFRISPCAAGIKGGATL